jgi:hypothetical protein
MNVRLSMFVLPLAFNLTACSAAPRSASYFQAHPQDAKAVAAACQAGAARGAECPNAQDGIAAAARDARMAAYRKSF